MVHSIGYQLKFCPNIIYFCDRWYLELTFEIFSSFWHWSMSNEIFQNIWKGNLKRKKNWMGHLPLFSTVKSRTIWLTCWFSFLTFFFCFCTFSIMCDLSTLRFDKIFKVLQNRTFPIIQFQWECCFLHPWKRRMFSC